MRASSLSLRMRRRFGGRGFLRNSARTPASVAAAMLGDLTRNAVDVLPGGRPRGEARARPAAAREARHRRHLARHPRRPRDSAPAHARLPGRRPRRRADHRRLHDPDRRPVGPVERAPDPHRRGDRREREAPTSSRRWSILDPERTEVRLQRRVALEALVRGRRPARAHDHRRADPRARRLREADGGAAADLGLGAPVPADAGVRLGRDRGGRRARRHRPALQPARRPRGDGALRPRAAGRPHDAAPRLVGRREDELVASATTSRSRRRPRRCSGARCGSRTRSSREWWTARRGAGVAGRRTRWSRSSRSRAGSWSARTARRPRAPREEHFNRVVQRARVPRGRAGRRRSRTAIRCTCRPFSSTASASARRSEARRLIEQGGVKLNGEPVVELDVAARASRAARCSRSASAVSAA